MSRKQIFFALAVATAAVATFVSPGTSMAQGAPERVAVIISFAHQPGQAEAAMVRGIGGTIKYRYHLVPAIAATVPSSAIDGLLRSAKVIAVEPDGFFHAIDAELDNTWGVKRIGSGIVHGLGNRGFGVNVAILDSGIDYTHPDLDGNYAGGYDFANNDSDPKDDNGHGTHVAGTVAAEDNDFGVVGVAPEANLYAVKVLGSSGGGSYSDVIAGLQWCVDNGMHVTNNSYGSSGDPGTAVKAAFDNSFAAGIIHIAAAGNSGNRKGKGDKVGYPARYDSVIAVAATTSSDSRASYSSTGPDVEIAAPGSSINSTKLGGGYVVFSGTSMASPHVAGVAALVIAAGMTNNDDVRLQLQTTADDLGDEGLDPLYGYGLVDADEAADVGEPNDAPVVTITSPSDGATFASGASISFAGSASDTEDGNVTASLVWTSSIDGQIGTGASFSAILSDGVHTITARATDTGSKSGSSSVSITVGNPPEEATTVSVTSITYATSGGKGGTKNLRISIACQNNLGAAVGGAIVSINLTNDIGGSWFGTATTGSDGTVTFQLRNAPAAFYTTVMTAVSAAGLTWDGVTPPNGFNKT
ncbi:MAG: S8 family serine peptidase [Armatimonadetes bacterium]|nr:S8 family serine peptidase [Armatimonadota bacterium]